MRNLFRLGMFLALGLGAPPAQADFSQPLTIIGLDVGDHGMLYIRFAEVTQCGSYFVYVPRSVPYYDSVLAVTLSAYSSGKRVTVWVSACEGQNPAQATRIVQGNVFN